MQTYRIHSSSPTFSASRNLQKVHYAVLLSMTTMGNGIGLHLVVCGRLVDLFGSSPWCVVCRLRIQHDALLKEEQGQTEFIEQFILQK